jgi:hypothetical protein
MTSLVAPSGAEVGHHPSFWLTQGPHVRVAPVQAVARRQTRLSFTRGQLPSPAHALHVPE